jgi:lysophospholipase L1-like esterase
MRWPQLLALFSAVPVLLCGAAGAVPTADVQLTENAKGLKLVTHERRTFSLAYEAAMAKFEAEQQAHPRRGGIVFTGSSSMVGWRSLATDMAPLPVVNHGFGGSTSAQLWWYADRAVLPLRPRVVVAYIGDNDLVQPSVTVGNYMKYIRLFRDAVWAADAHTRLVFIANKPSPARWQVWEKFQDANRRLQRMCSRDPRLAYADITPTLLDADGQVRPECFQKDRLHMKPEMYAEWTSVVRPIVERMWREARTD